MSAWNHYLCEACWTLYKPGSDPVRLKEQFRELETCCSCGIPTMTGILVREDPKKMLCAGVHREDH